MQKIIEYKGERYYLSTSRRYYASAKHKSLHRQIWVDNYGVIPRGKIVHHLDGNSFNNDISNLSLISKREHQQYHMKERMSDPEYYKKLLDNLKVAQVKSKEWHKSKEGKEWHSYKYTKQKWEYDKFICKICGKEFLSRRKTKAYTCCQEHAYKYRNLKNKLLNK